MTACATSPEVSEIASEVACPPTTCGFNSPEIDYRGFHDLHVGGLQNAAGFSINRMERAGLPYAPRVTNGRLYGDAPSGSYPSLAGHHLVGSMIYLDLNGLPSYAIRVREVNAMTFYAPPFDPIETYVLEYVTATGSGELGTEWSHICTLRPPDEGEDPELLFWNTLGQPFRDVLLFEGDRIDTRRMTMSSHSDPSWFNIGCSGHTLSKLHLTRNTIASQPGTYYGLWPERQATLKMLVADYCGTGRPFTVAGQELVWKGGLKYYKAPVTLEARWNEHGATCVHQPRMLTPTTELGAETFPDIWAAIGTECRPVRCDNRDPQAFEGALRVSSNL